MRRNSKILMRLPTMVIHRRTITEPAAALPQQLAVTDNITTSSSQEFEEQESPSDELVVDDSWLHSDNGSDDMDNTAMLLCDASFDESVDPFLQTSAFIMMDRRLVGIRRIDLARRVAIRPDFIGLAKCPEYFGDLIGIPRTRPRVRPVRENQLRAFYQPGVAPCASRLPYLVWPLVVQAGTHEQHLAIPTSLLTDCSCLAGSNIFSCKIKALTEACSSSASYEQGSRALSHLHPQAGVSEDTSYC